MTKPNFHAISDAFFSAMSSLSNLSEAYANSLDFISSYNDVISRVAHYF